MDITEIANSLLNGEVALLPTDTVYGLAASPLHEKAVNEIYSLKQRPRTQNLPIMVASVKDLEKMGVEISLLAQKILDSELVPGDITLVLGFKDKPVLAWLQGREEVAIRIPNHQNLLEILGKTGPLLVTSANKHGNPNMSKHIAEVLADLNGLPGVVVEGKVGENVPSTIVNCRVNPPIIERQGRILNEDILNVLNS